MLFSNLHALLKSGVTLNLILAAVGDDKVEVTVLPNSEKSSAGTQLVAKTFVATPQELDAQFPEVMAGYASTNLSLKEQLEAVQKQADAAAASAAEAAKAEAAKKPAAKSGSKANPKPTLRSEDEGDADDGAEGDVSASGAGSAKSISGAAATAQPSQPQLISL